MQTPSATEIAALVLLMLLSFGAASVRVRRVWRAIRGSRPEPGYRLRPIFPRLARVVREVALQAKVIRERPWPGVAHALVFWGFCAFGFSTVDHLAAGFGVDLISRDSPLGAAYFDLVALFAVAVAVAITALAARRFLARPKWLGEISPESGLIAALILVLMLTYLADHWEWSGGAGLRVNWWIHTLALLVFLPLIPHTKHFHLALSPVTVFLKRRGLGTIPPLEGDEDFGWNAGKDVTRLTALQAFTCVECGRCTEHCPAYNTGKELNPKEVILGFRRYLDEHGPGAAAPLAGRHLSLEEAFQCTTCGACEHQCPVGVQHLQAITGLRRGAVNTGQWDDDHGSQLFVNLERHGNPLGISARERDKFIEQAGLPLFDGSQEYCLWLGCMGAYDPQGRETVVALARLLNHLGVRFGVLKREKCTGDAARRLGNDLAFAELAQENLQILSDSGVARLLSICPHCVRTISVDWREHGEPPAIEHHAEFLYRHRERLPRRGGGRIVFHDPCYLGRYREVYDEPRGVLALAGTLAEAPRNRERSFCCGAGGGLVFLGEEKGKRVSHERLEQLESAGAETIAAACPFCQTMFRDALAGRAGAMRLADIAQLAAEGLPAPAIPPERAGNP